MEKKRNKVCFVDELYNSKFSKLCLVGNSDIRTPPENEELVLFSEYFHGETGRCVRSFSLDSMGSLSLKNSHAH